MSDTRDSKGPAYAPPPPSPEAHYALLKARIAFFRKMNTTPEYVAKMEAELAEIEGRQVAA